MADFTKMAPGTCLVVDTQLTQPLSWLPASASNECLSLHTWPADWYSKARQVPVLSDVQYCEQSAADATCSYFFSISFVRSIDVSVYPAGHSVFAQKR